MEQHRARQIALFRKVYGQYPIEKRIREAYISYKLQIITHPAEGSIRSRYYAKGSRLLKQYIEKAISQIEFLTTMKENQTAYLKEYEDFVSRELPPLENVCINDRDTLSFTRTLSKEKTWEQLGTHQLKDRTQVVMQIHRGDIVLVYNFYNRSSGCPYSLEYVCGISQAHQTVKVEARFGKLEYDMYLIYPLTQSFSNSTVILNRLPFGLRGSDFPSGLTLTQRFSLVKEYKEAFLKYKRKHKEWFVPQNQTLDHNILTFWTEKAHEFVKSHPDQHMSAKSQSKVC